jgi:hypothetical protein
LSSATRSAAGYCAQGFDVGNAMHCRQHNERRGVAVRMRQKDEW